MTIALAILAGAIFRRWWGDARPSWAFPGFRGLQALGGLLALFALCLWAGTAWPLAALKAGLAIGFLTAVAQSIPHVWQAFDWLDGRLPRGLPKLGRWFTGWTTYSEATAGALVFAVAI